MKLIKILTYKKYEKLLGDLEKHNRTLKDLTQEILKLQKELNQVKFEKTEYKNQIEKKYEEDTFKLQSEINKRNIELSNCNLQIGVYKKDIQSLTKQNKKIEEEKEKLQEIIINQEKEIKRLKNRPTIEELRNASVSKEAKKKLAGTKKRD